MQCQIVCIGCRNILVYPRGATNVCCAVCNTITSVPPSGTEVAQLICGCCRTLLMHARGASNVKCPCCDTINLVREANRVAHLDCGQCRTTLMYPYGAVSVKCTICHFITDVRMSNLRVPFHRANGAAGMMMQATTSAARPPACETVLVENPMSLDANGNLVTNVVVGVGRGQM